MSRQSLAIVTMSLVGLCLGACTTTQERIGGAGTGALVGSIAGPPGAVVGAIGGAIVGPTVSNATIDRHHRRKWRRPPPE